MALCTDEQNAFASLAETRTELRDAEEIYERLHALGPGCTEYNEIRDALADDDDPDASARAEIALLVRPLPLLLLPRLLTTDVSCDADRGVVC